MMRVAVAALLIVWTTPASAQTLFSRSGGWEISQKGEFCIMRHAPAGITATRSVNGRMALDVTSPNWSFVNGQDYSLQLIAPDMPVVTGWRSTGSSMAGGPSGFSMMLYDKDQLTDELTALFAARTVTVHFYSGEQGDLTFAMPPSATAARDLDRCLADIKAHEGGSGRPAVTPPRLRGTQEDLMTPDDYPVAAIRSQTGGTATVRLTVTAIGYPSACAVIAPSGSELLDKTTCGIYQRRARFEPALDAKGRPTTGTYDFTKQWIVPPITSVPNSTSRKY